MDYLRYRIETDPATAEILLAFLSELPFDSFEETEAGLDAYLANDAKRNAVDLDLKKLQTSYTFYFQVEKIPHRNWNAEWEANFQPVQVGKFCGIRADFHPPMPDVRYELVINPKMAFGTGHHETTHMMIQMMRELSLKGAKALDYGCGTGILAILAAKLGASAIDAVDIEAEAYQNTLENAQINHVHNIQVIHGTLPNVLDSEYDVILANINRNVILDSFSALHQRLKRNGVLLISGILQKDLGAMQSHIRKYRFTLDEKLERGGWMCLKLLK